MIFEKTGYAWTVDMGMSRDGLERYLKWSGYWGDAYLRKRHAYVLSPCAYVMDHSWAHWFDRVAKDLYQGLRNLNSYLCDLAAQKSHTHEEARFMKLATPAARSLLRPIDGVRDVPPVLKIDFVPDTFGVPYIAEVDAYNPRGLGYASLLDGSIPSGFRKYRQGGSRVLGDIASVFPKNVDEKQPLHILVSEFERYYTTAFTIFAEELSRRERPTKLLHESECREDAGRVASVHSLLMIPESMNTAPVARDELLERYKSGDLQLFYPPVPYLGSKAFLPYLQTQKGLGEVIPKSVLVGRDGAHKEVVASGKPLMLKAVVSSGMKGVYFSDLDAAVFTQTLETAESMRKSAWIVQEQIPQSPLRVTIFDAQGKRVTKEYYLRLTAYIDAYGLLDLGITGRPDRRVHGASDCIMLPVLFM